MSTNAFKLMNDLERNNIHFPIVIINTKFLNNLQPEWLKYVTQVRLVKRLIVDTFDDLFDYLQQFEKLVNASREKKLTKSHDLLALVTHTGSSSRNTSSYYGKGHYARNCPKPRVRDSNYFMEQMMLAKQDEAGVLLTDEHNDFLFADASRMEESEELNLEKQRDKLDLAVNDYKRKNEELQKTHLILKRHMSENEDRYHDTILDLEAKLKKNVDLILKLRNSLQGMFMLGPKPLSVLSNSEIPLNVKDTEDTLDDASKSQQKMKEKMNDPIAVANKQNFSSASTHVSTGRRVSIVSTDAKSLWAAISIRFEEMMNPKDAENIGFLSSENTSSTNEVSIASRNFGVNTARGTSSTNQVSSTPCADEVVCSFFAQQTTSSPLNNEDLQQIVQDNLEE
ncbi:hypothetical protein Tco_0046931 [Tanacetum coccineum]